MCENYKTIELENAVIYFSTGKFIHIHYKSYAFTLKENKEIFDILRENSPWEVCPYLISSDDFSTHDKDSKIYNASREVVQHCSAYAFIVTNTAQKLMVNFFVRLMDPEIPRSFFDSEQKAEEWLSAYTQANLMKNEMHPLTA